MGDSAKERFIFLGGVPVFDYMISVTKEEIAKATDNKLLVVGPRILLPVGTIFQIHVEGLGKTVFINPMANRDVQYVHDEPYYAMEFGGKHPEQYPFALCADKQHIVNELKAAFPKVVQKRSDLKVVEVSAPVKIHLGGNNKNLIEEIKTLYSSPELAGDADDIAFEHLFFFDTENPKFRMVEELYGRLGVSMGEPEDLHVAGLTPREGYVFTIISEDGKAMDRIILANRTNEETIPIDKLNKRYFALEYKLRKDENFAETHLVVNSMTNHEELRLLSRIFQTSHASGVTCYLCPTMTFLKCIDRLIETGFYTTENEQFFQYRKDFIYTAIIPYIQYMILNKEELTLLDNVVAKKGIDATASIVANRMNRGRRGESQEGGKIIVTGGSKGVRFTERLSPDTAKLFWKKAKLPGDRRPRFAERRIVCGDDYVTELTSTLGAGDVFTGSFIGLNALSWDVGHALRAATLGAQHFIQNRTKPRVRDMLAMDESHIRMGTETELADVISHHIDESGDPTRYGTISDTVITINTTQIQHPFQEVLELERRFSGKREAA